MSPPVGVSKPAIIIRVVVFPDPSDHRLVEIADDGVTLTWKDYSDASRIKHMTLAPVEFIRRFLLHVLPDGFQRIRSCQRQSKGKTRSHPPAAASATADRNQRRCHSDDRTGRLRGIRSEDEWQPTCPECGGEMEIVETLAKARRNGGPQIDMS